jgi:glycosyltransferase involved in cell wall biosynthesis
MADTLVTSPRPASASPSKPAAVWICSYLPSSRGAGVERFVEMMANIAKKAGFHPKVIDMTTVVPQTARFRKLRYYVAWRVGREVNRAAKPEDVIICNNFFSWNARRSRSMVVYHGTDKGRALKNRRNMSLLRNVAVRTIGAHLEKKTGTGRMAIAVSNSAREEVEEHYHVGVREVIPNAVDLELFSPGRKKAELRRSLGLPLDKFLILFVGTSDPRKGLAWILNELRPGLRPSQRLVLRTDGIIPSDDVTVIGRLPTRQLADLYRACDVLVFPTSYEGCSFALVEALASGLPVITSPAGSGRDLESDLLLKPYIISGNDTDKYLDSITRLESSPSEWALVSSAARTYAERHHGLADFERRYLEIIKELGSQEVDLQIPPAAGIRNSPGSP